MAQATRPNKKRSFQTAELDEFTDTGGIPQSTDYDFDDVNDNNHEINDYDIDDTTNTNNKNHSSSKPNPAKRHTSFKREPFDPNANIIEDHILEPYNDVDSDDDGDGDGDGEDDDIDPDDPDNPYKFRLIEEELAPSEDEDGNPIPIFKDNEPIITQSLRNKMANLSINPNKDNNNKSSPPNNVINNNNNNNNNSNNANNNDEDVKMNNNKNNSNSNNVNGNNKNKDKGMLDVHDLHWEDSDDEMAPGDKKDKIDDTKEEEEKQQVWLPNSQDIGQNNSEDQKYEYDQSAYSVLHQFNTEWPCLSFDFIRDNLGAYRTNVPHTVYLACGTQADINYHNPSLYTPNLSNQNKEHYRTQNKILLLKTSNLQKTKYDNDETDENEENDKDYADITDDNPILQNRDINHKGGCVNRLRCCNKSKPGLIATWSEDSNVYIWDAEQHLKSLDGNAERPELVKSNIQPVFEANHIDEGFGLAWSGIDEGKLLTGSCSGELCLYQPKSGTWIRTHKFKTPKTSFEDIAWSPNEGNIFATVSTDRCIRIFDTRPSKKCQCVSMVKSAHSDDINVLSWNPIHKHLLLTGSDDQSFKVWNLNKFPKENKKKTIKPHAHYKWHTSPITSVDWCPHDASTCVISGEDNQITIWDLSLEEDNAGKVRGAHLPTNMKIPPQLVFVHAGQHEIKEVKFHQQIPNMLCSTAGSGMHLFQPDNLVEAMENINLD